MKGGILVLLLIGISVYFAQIALRSQSGVSPTGITLPARVSFRLAFGTDGTAKTPWNGTIEAENGRIIKLDGWHFSTGDRIEGNGRWVMSIDKPLLGTVPRKGVIVAVDAKADTRFRVKTSNGNFSFTAGDIPFPARLRVLQGLGEVERVPNMVVLTPSDDDQDYPALAGSGDDVYLAYIEFSHPDRNLESFATMKKAPVNFDWLARPAGGDRVRLIRYSKSARRWEGTEDVSPPHEDCMRVTLSVDGQHCVWVIWSANRAGNFDLYARYLDSGRWSRELRLTSDTGTDVNPVAATDSAGHVWVAWQGFRGGNLEVLVKAQANGERFTDERKVSFSPASDWDPAIAAGPHGEVAVTWDTYDKGDYDVYARRMRYVNGVVMDKPMPVAAALRREARQFTIGREGCGSPTRQPVRCGARILKRIKQTESACTWAIRCA